MSNQRENRLFASVKTIDGGAGADFAVVSRTAAVPLVERSGAGSYLVTFIEAIADGEETHELCVRGISDGEGGFNAATGAVERVNAAQYRVRTFNAAGVAAESGFSLTMHRVGP